MPVAAGWLRAVVCALLATLLLVACRPGRPGGAAGRPGEAGATAAPTPPSQVVLAREAGAGKAKLVIDRGCSRLGVAEGEVVCVTNQDSRPVDMGRWLLRNRMGRTHYFRDGFVLAPGATVRVHTVAGTDTETDLYWGYQFTPAWEKRDKLTLVDRSNEQVDVLDTTA